MPSSGPRWLLVAEVQANMAFSGVKFGARLQVDIDDPAVAGLIKGGYLKITREGGDDAGTVDSPVDPDGVEFDVAGDLGSGGVGKLQTEEELDGQGEHRPESEGPDRS